MVVAASQVWGQRQSCKETVGTGERSSHVFSFYLPLPHLPCLSSLDDINT